MDVSLGMEHAHKRSCNWLEHASETLKENGIASTSQQPHCHLQWGKEQLTHMKTIGLNDIASFMLKTATDPALCSHVCLHASAKAVRD